MTANLYMIETLTNLHVGGTGNEIGIVDKPVQRDMITNFPFISAPSLKGALRSGMRGLRNEEMIFGNEITDKDSRQGTFVFHDAHLLFYPVRSNGSQPYYLAACPAMLKQARQYDEMAGGKGKIKEIIDSLMQIIEEEISGARKGILLKAGNILKNAYENVEFFRAPVVPCESGLMRNINECLGGSEKGIVLVDDGTMMELLEDLPVIARNQLNNGISQNLWYEEFVPRASVFLTMITAPADDGDLSAFERILCSERGMQIGANATVGYGYCHFHRV